MKNDRKKFYTELERLCRTPEISILKSFTQHKGTPTFVHCRNVAVYSFHLAEKLGWKIDEISLAKGAMLHDYYLYTVAEKQKETNLSDYRHGITHPQLSLENASKVFQLTPKEKNIIRSHMWPLTLFHIPASKEAWLVCLADTYCAIREMLGDKEELDPEIHSAWIRNYAKRKVQHALSFT